MSETIGFIGVGLIGSNIAKLAVDAGYKVVLSNRRGPDTLKKTVEALGKSARAATPLEVATDKSIKIVVFTVPLSAVPTLGPEIGGLKDKIVIDTNNYYPGRDGNIEQLDSKKVTTAEYVASYLDSSARLVKVFNNIYACHLQPAAANPQTLYLPLSGDDDKAKAVVSTFVNKIGFGTVDYGTLKDSWKQEPQSPVYCDVYAPKVPENLSEEEQTKYFATKYTPTNAEKVKELLNEPSRETLEVGGSFDVNSPIAKVFFSLRPIGQ